MNRFGTDSQTTELVSEQWGDPALAALAVCEIDFLSHANKKLEI